MRLDRPVLVSNLASGAAWLLLLAAPWPGSGGVGSWLLLVEGAAYVAAASVYLAAVYARETLTVRQEAWAWVAPWLAAIAWWTLITVVEEWGSTSPAVALGCGLFVMTPSYVAWQAGALAFRAGAARRARTRSGS